MARNVATSRIPTLALLAALVSALVCSNGCRVGYELLSPSEAGGAGGDNTASVGGSAADGGDTATSGTTSSAGQSNTAGCTLETDPGVTYEAGEVAELNGFYVLRPLSSDECLQTASCLASQEAVYEPAGCSFEACQIFQAVERGSRLYSLQNLLSGYCLDAGGMAGGSTVVDFTCAPPGGPDEPRQIFQLVCDGDDAWRLINPTIQSYVGVAAGTADGAAIEFQAQLGGDEQRFSVEARASVFEAVVPTSEADPGQLWRYVTRRPKSGWEQATFDDSSWSEGPGGFGDGLAISSPARTSWTTDDIWLRRSFTLDSLPTSLDLRINHDFNAEVYINGVEAAVLPNWTSGYAQLPLSETALASLVVGNNVVAVHCFTDQFGEQFIDLGFGHLTW